MVRTIGTVWKEEPQWDKQGKWKVQLPKGIATFRTKREAVAVSKTLVR